MSVQTKLLEIGAFHEKHTNKTVTEREEKVYNEFSIVHSDYNCHETGSAFAMTVKTNSWKRKWTEKM